MPNQCQCDLCGKPHSYLESLKDEYQTESITQVCGECASLINNHLWKVRELTHGIIRTAVKRFIANMKLQKAPADTNCIKAKEQNQ